jgi:predicted DNA-binding transcriptional regulator YafY
MSQMERMYEIDQMLKSRRATPLEVFMENTSASRATIIRDLTYMKDRLRAPIVWDRDLRGYRLDGPFSLPAVYLNEAEIHALLVLHELVARIQPSFLDEHLGPLRKLLHQLIGSGGGYDTNLEHRIRILQIASRPVSSQHFQTVCRALLARERLRLRYFSRTRNQETDRVVSPQRLVHYRDNWYLDAWCHSRNGLRSFALDAMLDASPEKEEAIQIPDEQLDRELGTGYGIFSGEQVCTAVLRFTPEMARWVSREKWHRRQEGTFGADGSYTLKVPYSAERELVMDIMRFGPEVEVLGPPELRERVSAALKKALSAYSSEIR